MGIIVFIHRVVVRINERRYVEHWSACFVQMSGTKEGLEEAGVLVVVSF